MKKIIKTPEDRFRNLTGYNFKSNYLAVEEGLELHYLDEGKKDAPIVLLLHGEPSWSYLYRKMIPVLVANNFRAIAPDLIGFGKSDKLIEQKGYSYQNHQDWLTTFIKELNLTNIVLFCQDWGGLLGLRIVTEMPKRFSMIVASNTFLPIADRPTPESFLQWRAYSQHSSTFDIGKVINMGTYQELTDDVIAAYNAPYPSEEYKAGARIFPMLVPIEHHDPEAAKNRDAWKHLTQWEKPFLTIFGTKDDIMKGAEKVFQKLIPGAKDQHHTLLEAGHFIQEEKGEELAKLIIDFYLTNNYN